MKLASLEHYSVQPGRFVQWVPECAAANSSAVTVMAVSENERFHLDSVQEGHLGWMTLVIDIPRSVPRELLRRMASELMSRHDALRSHFVAGDDYVRHHHQDVPAMVDDEIDARDWDAQALTDEVLRRTASACNPLRSGGHFLSAVCRPDSTTVICAFDHAYVDARSLTVIAADITDVLAERPLRPAASGLDEVRAHIRLPDVPADDPRLAGWEHFLEQSDWQIPDFPLDLGVGPGERKPMRTAMRTLVAADDAPELSSGIRRHGGRTLSALLTAIGVAVHRSGGPEEMSTIIPAGPQTDRRFVGWVVDNIPMRVAGSGDPLELSRINARRVAEATPLAEIGLTPVYQTFGDRLRRSRDDVFMLSYVDYTRWYTPADGVEVRQLSGDHDTDNAQWWLWRDESGIHVRVRYPDTDQAEKIIDAVLSETVSVIGEIVDRVTMPAARAHGMA